MELTKSCPNEVGNWSSVLEEKVIFFESRSKHNRSRKFKFVFIFSPSFLGKSGLMPAAPIGRLDGVHPMSHHSLNKPTLQTLANSSAYTDIATGAHQRIAQRIQSSCEVYCDITTDSARFFHLK